MEHRRDTDVADKGAMASSIFPKTHARCAALAMDTEDTHALPVTRLTPIRPAKVRT